MERTVGRHNNNFNRSVSLGTKRKGVYGRRLGQTMQLIFFEGSKIEKKAVKDDSIV